MARLRRLAEKPAVKDTLQAVQPPGVGLKTRRIATNQYYEHEQRTGKRQHMRLIGIDTGGTFTDTVIIDND